MNIKQWQEVGYLVLTKHCKKEKKEMAKKHGEDRKAGGVTDFINELLEKENDK
ncbi:hypothetical protein HOP38_16180 [Vibrio mediterranei]|uniref:hypothetical protein n=1 Tax=Vibrio mediterranei TaxID=689 RepID=UPI0017E695A0|nr:hypothetical protein [Vibrio mediterranei]NUW74030.1 hypothetical protein [Vibrio mediterranei]